MKQLYRNSTVPLLVLMMAVSLFADQGNSSVRDQVALYCKLDASGRQLISGSKGWIELARMFLPGEPVLPSLVTVTFDKLEVIRAYSVGNVSRAGRDHATVLVIYKNLGEIDYESLRFVPAPQTNDKTTEAFNLRLSTKHYDIDHQGKQEILDGSLVWRIEGMPPRPHIAVDAAILLVAQLKDKTSNMEAKRNATASLSELRRLRSEGSSAK